MFFGGSESKIEIHCTAVFGKQPERYGHNEKAHLSNIGIEVLLGQRSSHIGCVVYSAILRFKDIVANFIEIQVEIFRVAGKIYFALTARS